ncbi:glutaredoxin [Candidatus Ruthia magnifica str. Cm (Calyptogena magnifica)]|uniref:Glutaredoxin n=1 Tax=Ruthia magnifica subsp. Calyptogena magnifica TaxID=413404 RepID=A1AXI9_RUTMC|nr:glutaredoxin domain-containing protein [Candidatus Ruthturnera calyptogenae]ABL02646.1 glutaredoxin [Candidatus Ruthia magnifica str. Cm (Calyptogena magnifica)]
MKKNIIYCSYSCFFCQRAYQLLKKRDISFKKYHVKNIGDWNEVKEKIGRKTVPKVFINDFHISRFDDLLTAEQSGKLDEILN